MTTDTTDTPTRSDAQRVILVAAPELDRALRRDPRIELVRVENALQALGELSIDDSSDPQTTSLILGPASMGELSPKEILDAVREVRQRVRVFALCEPDASLTEAGLHAIAPDDLPSALFTDELPTTIETGTRKGEKKKKKKKDKHRAQRPTDRKDDRASSAGSLGDERVLLRIILSGGDPTHEIVARVSDTLKNDHVEFVRAIDHEDPPEVNGGYVTHKVARRGHTFGWLVGPAELGARLDEQAETIALWLSLSDQHRQLRTLAFTDSLTGAWNRRYFDKYLASAIAEARHKRQSLTLMVFDIDDFKIYNDEYGHAAGDEILIETIRLLKSHVRPNDKVCRVGGDEFAVVFYDPAGPRDPTSHHPRSIFQIARRFQQQIANHNFPKLAERAKGSLTISGGLATFPWDAYDAEGLLERADKLSIVSKNQGKNVLTIGESASSESTEEQNGPDLPEEFC